MGSGGGAQAATPPPPPVTLSRGPGLPPEPRTVPQVQDKGGRKVCVDLAAYAKESWPWLRAAPALAERLRRCLLLLTSRGLVPASARVCFAEEYGNAAGDLLRALPGFPFPVLSAAYLALGPADAPADAAGPAPAVREWRRFFEELGVSDLPRPERRALAVRDRGRSLWAQARAWPAAPEYEVQVSGSAFVGAVHLPTRRGLMPMHCDLYSQSDNHSQ